MTDKLPAQAMGDGSHKGEADGSGGAAGQGGQSSGGQYPHPPRKKAKHGWRGGQSVQGYHGSGQLGDD